MNLLFKSLFFISLLSAICCEEDLVISLTKENFNSTIQGVQATIVEFYTPWCGFCQKLAPELAMAAKELKPRGFSIYKVDCQQEEELCHAHDIQGYPSIKTFIQGKFYRDFIGRTAAAITTHIERMNLPAVQAIDTINKLSNTTDIAILGVFKAEHAAISDVFHQFANKYRETANFAILSNPDSVVGDLGVTAPAVVAFKSDGKRSVFGKEPLTEASLKKFVFVERLPAIGMIDEESYSKYMEAELPIAYIFYILDDDRAALTESLAPVAEKFKYKIAIAFIDGFEHGSHAQVLGLVDEKFPAVTVQDPVKNYKYPLNQNATLTAAMVESHLQGILDGTIPPSFNSGPIPDHASEGPVKTVVHDNFRDVVMNPKKDVVVKLYAHWCQACKRLAPVYDALAAQLSKVNDTLMITRMDLEKNDQPQDIHLEFHTIPAIFIFPAGDKSPVKYEGNHTLASIVDFINQHATHKMDVTVLQPVEQESEPEISHEDL